MAYSKPLAVRVRKFMRSFDYLYSEKKMFGGLMFLYRGNIACGVHEDKFVVSILEPLCSEMLEKDPLVKVMDVAGQPMQELVSVDPAKITQDVDLLMFITLGVAHASQQATR